MFKIRVTTKQRENTAKILSNLITMDVASLIAGNILNLKGFLLPIFTMDCIILLAFYLVVLWIER